MTQYEYSRMDFALSTVKKMKKRGQAPFLATVLFSPFVKEDRDCRLL